MGRGVPVLSHVEVAVSEPKTVFDLDVDVPFTLQKSNRSDPISPFDVILKSGHFFSLNFVVGSVFRGGAFDLGFGDRGSGAIHFKNIKFKSK